MSLAVQVYPWALFAATHPWSRNIPGRGLGPRVRRPYRCLTIPGLLSSGAEADYDVSASGQFLVRENAASGTSSSIHIVENWLAEFRDHEQD